jgi:NADH-quinone oxidoreductase subunit A
MLERDLSAYSELIIYFVSGVVFISAGLLTAWLIRPNRPNPEKNTVYECGEDPVGSAWGQFNIRFYVLAILFLLFEVEVVFLLPWAVIFDSDELIAQTDGIWSVFAFTEAFIFVTLLALGLAFAWAKGFLSWEKPKITLPEVETSVPATMYEAINQKYN